MSAGIGIEDSHVQNKWISKVGFLTWRAGKDLDPSRSFGIDAFRNSQKALWGSSWYQAFSLVRRWKVA